jgi:hypothetical protein
MAASPTWVRRSLLPWYNTRCQVTSRNNDCGRWLRPEYCRCEIRTGIKKSSGDCRIYVFVTSDPSRRTVLSETVVWWLEQSAAYCTFIVIKGEAWCRERFWDQLDLVTCVTCLPLTDTWCIYSSHYSLEDGLLLLCLPHRIITLCNISGP